MAEMEGEKLEAEKLFEAVETIMNPSIGQERRGEAYRICENFKETSPLCAHCGLLLSSIENPPVVRHFGLQLIEHHIKFRWNFLSQEEKCCIKNSAMNLLTKGTNSILDEEAHIKDGMSRIIVEMIKREWPQQWPELLNELSELCKVGETQKELVCLIFLRLVEDIVTLQNVQNQRRREIYQALTSNLQKIFVFFVTSLKTHYYEYKTLETQKELVCLIFLRLVEDIVTLQNVQNQRRREIYQALTSNLQKIFVFFVTSLKTHYYEYKTLVS
ncbi:exportin-5-like [Centruroides sculpturatus]|uniref:exportin-5-like n=1 Tax=Centruroides sculpturatus TaxID=218467 RepID=UPI000C6E8730|nr:exportin-5-like [Centruroides sculpturatus]